GFGGRSECPRMVAWSFAAVPNASACRRGHSQPFRMPAAGMIRTTLSLLQKSLLDVPSALHEKQHGIVNEQQYEYQTAECQCCIDGAEQVGGEAAEHRADHSAEPLHGADDTPRLGAAAFRSEEHTSELQSRFDLECRLLLEKKKKPHVQQDKPNLRQMFQMDESDDNYG